MPKTFVNIKEDILMVTRNLLAEEGYGKLNVRTIASKCGIATGTLYNYYKSKQEIVEEILNNEWNMMLRRVDQGMKANCSVIDRLGKVYSELSILMNDVHNIWFENTGLNIDDNELSRIKCHKETILKSLTVKIFHIIYDEGRNKDYELLSDIICRLFISYAYEGKVEFKKLSPVIASLLRNE